MLNLNTKTQTFLKTIKDFFSVFFIALIIMITIIMILIKIFGWNMFSINSASMSPQYPVDTLIIVQPVEPDDIQIGDVITYVFNEEGLPVTHRVINIDKQNKTFTTRGDANNSEDPMPILWDNLIGKVVLKVPKIGKPVRFITAKENRHIIIAAIVILFAIPPGIDVIKKYTGNKKKGGEE